MLTFPGKALLIKLYYQSGKSVTETLQSHRQKRNVKDLLRTPFGEDHVLCRHFYQGYPPKSPDLNPCGYWLSRYLNSQVN
ncbi:hypothetical protein TNCV_4731591 [Trichonephila clavipes]|nr:hypothetical protein TNCV_4731591 [Trichonephila clavipes]